MTSKSIGKPKKCVYAAPTQSQGVLVKIEVGKRLMIALLSLPDAEETEKFLNGDNPLFSFEEEITRRR